jgi:hypothetical protein
MMAMLVAPVLSSHVLIPVPEMSNKAYEGFLH